MLDQNRWDIALYLAGCLIFLCIFGVGVASLVWGIVVPANPVDNRILLVLLSFGNLLVAVGAVVRRK